MTIKPRPLAQLVEDMAVYPRHAVDDTHVASLVLALNAGAILPPPVVEKKSGRIVDGWHRVRAFRRVLGATGVIDVDERVYAREEDLLLDAVGLNASHGRRLDRIDQVRIIGMLESVGLAEDAIATVLQVPPARVIQLRVRVATVKGHEELVPLKRPALHFAGKELTQDQYVAHQRMAGTSFLLQVRQVTDGLKFNLMNRSDERLMNSLMELQAELHQYLAKAA